MNSVTQVVHYDTAVGESAGWNVGVEVATVGRVVSMRPCPHLVVCATVDGGVSDHKESRS